MRKLAFHAHPLAGFCSRRLCKTPMPRRCPLRQRLLRRVPEAMPCFDIPYGAPISMDDAHKSHHGRGRRSQKT